MYVCVCVNEHAIVETVHWIELKFPMRITAYRRTSPIDFGECRMHSFLQEDKKDLLYITYCLWSQIL